MTVWKKWKTTTATVTPNIVGAYSEWLFYFDQLIDMSNSANAGCYTALGGSTPQVTFVIDTIFMMRVPSNFFVLVDDGKMQATLGDVAMKTWMYEKTNQIFFQVMQTMDCGDSSGVGVLYPLKLT